MSSVVAERDGIVGEPVIVERVLHAHPQAERTAPVERQPELHRRKTEMEGRSQPLIQKALFPGRIPRIVDADQLRDPNSILLNALNQTRGFFSSIRCIGVCPSVRPNPATSSTTLPSFPPSRSVTSPLSIASIRRSV